MAKPNSTRISATEMRSGRSTSAHDLRVLSLIAQAAGIINAGMPGVQGATAIAATIFGENNPGGKLRACPSLDSLPYLAAVHYNLTAVHLYVAHIAALRTFWTDWYKYLRKLRSFHKTARISLALQQACQCHVMHGMPGYCTVIHTHTVGFLTIPRASIKWVQLALNVEPVFLY